MCRDQPSYMSFPSLYALASSKEAWVVDVKDDPGGGGGRGGGGGGPLECLFH